MIEVCNRQRLLKVDTRRLKRIAGSFAGKPLTIVLVTDRAIARLNERFHRVAGPTDVLTFDYGDQAEVIISVERAVAHAKAYRTTPARELALYVAHGILHLRGYSDATPRQRAKMRAAERRLLARLSASR
jgi:probable rRNA maturation factor